MKIEILTVRDPDSYTEVYLFVDGVEIPNGYVEESVDPGAGYTLASWDEHTTTVNLNNDLSPAFRDKVVETRRAYRDSEFITDEE